MSVRVTTHLVSLPMGRVVRSALHAMDAIECALVEIEDDGLVGIGYTFAFSREEAEAIRAAMRYLTGALGDTDPRSTLECWQRMLRASNFTGSCGLAMLAVGAIDTALWDLKAKRASMPLFRLLGGARTAVPVYMTGGFLESSLDDIRDEVAQLRGLGIRNYKIKLGSGDWRTDLERVAAIQEIAGDDVAVAIDVNQNWSLRDARLAVEVLNRDFADIYWLEEPIAASDVTGLAELRQRSRAPIAAGETLHTPRGIRPLLDERAVDVLMPNLMRLGGPTGYQQVLALAELANVTVSSHVYPEISVHLMSGVANPDVIEYMPDWWERLFDDGRPQVEAGALVLSERPGLGYGFSADAIERWSRDPELVMGGS
jgi:L-alanine-DL-glutamate epimerase-like enolase superfamily enzyme